MSNNPGSSRSFTSPRAATKDYLEKRKTLSSASLQPFVLSRPPSKSQDGSQPTNQSLLEDETFQYYMNYERLLEQLLQTTCGDPLSKMYEFQYPEYFVVELDTSMYLSKLSIGLVSDVDITNDTQPSPLPADTPAYILRSIDLFNQKSSLYVRFHPNPPTALKQQTTQQQEDTSDEGEDILDGEQYRNITLQYRKRPSLKKLSQTGDVPRRGNVQQFLFNSHLLRRVKIESKGVRVPER
jgi:hypothetical protein